MGCRPTAGVAGRLWGGGWRGAPWRGPLSPLRSTGRRPAAGPGRLWGGGRLGARWRGPPLCLAGRRPAVGFGRLRGDTVRSILTRHNCTSTQLFTFPYRNSTRTHQLTHSSFGLEPGPDSDRVTPKIPLAQLHTSSHPPITFQHPYPSFAPPSIANGDLGPLWEPPFSPVGQCGAASNLPAALVRRPPPSSGRRGGRRPRGVGYYWVPFGAWRLE